MDALEWALWGDDAGSDEGATPPLARTRRSPIRGTGGPRADPLLVHIARPGETQPDAPISLLRRPERVHTTLRRRKGEIARLRIAADYLEKCLARLRDQRRTPPHAATTSKGHPHETAGACAAAMEELDQLEKSQRENHRLRGQIREKHTLARELEDQVRKQFEALQDVFPVARSPPTPFAGAPGDVEADVLAGLLHTLNAMYLQTDDVFADDVRYATITPTFTDIDIHAQQDTNTLAIELRDSRLVPFDVKRTASAVWQNVLGRSVRPQSGWVQQLPNETLLSHFVAHMDIPGFEGNVRAIMTLRRVVEESRVVIVRCSIFTHVYPGHRSPMNSRLLTWTIVGQPRHPALHTREGLAQVQLCSVGVPSLSGDEDEAMVSELTRLFVAVSKRMNEEAHEEVDSNLLRRSVS